MTTEVLARNRINNLRPTSQFSLASIMVRAPQDYGKAPLQWVEDEQNYVFLACGYGQGNCAGECQAQLEVKTTINSSSSLNITDIGTNHVQLRVVRIGNAVVVMYREMPEGSWILHRRYDRSDFPDTLQVGLTTYTDWSKVQSVGYAFHNQNTLLPGVSGDPSPETPFDPTLIAEFDFYRLTEFIRPMDLQTADFSNPSEVTNETLLSLLDFQSLPHCPKRMHVLQPFIDIPFINQRADTLKISSKLGAESNLLFTTQCFEGEPEFELSNGASLTVENGGCD